jgi:hypothetical protein
VVLDVEIDDRAWRRGRQQVQRVRRVPGEDHDVFAAGPDERGHLSTGGFVGRGTDEGGVSSPPVHAGVQGQDLVDPGRHALQGRRAGRIVEVGVWHLAALDHGNLL